MSEPDDDSEIKNVNPARIQRGPLRRESLAPDQEKRVQAIHSYVKPYLGMTLEEFEIAFLRDSDPDSEINVWAAIVKAHGDFVKQRPDKTADVGLDVFRCVLSISMGATKPSDVSKLLWDEVQQFCSDR
jgi:hypothetical protein